MHIEYKFNNKLKCFINSTIIDIGRRYRSAIIVCPGGGYCKLSEREADAVALRYAAYGFQAFVLKYSLEKYPAPAYDLIKAVEIIRENAEIWDIDENQIIACGFSAGGHLAATVGCADSLEHIVSDTRINGLILCYPVISSDAIISHKESIDNLTKNDLNLISEVSLENKVNNKTPSTFIWHCIDDAVVDVKNSIRFMESLSKNNIYFEGHIFSSGGHGVSLSDECTAEIESQINEECAKWFELSVKFIKKLRILND